MMRYVGLKYVDIGDRIGDRGEDEFKDQPRLINMKWILALVNLPLTLKKIIQQPRRMRRITRMIHALICDLHKDFCVPGRKI